MLQILIVLKKSFRVDLVYSETISMFILSILGEIISALTQSKEKAFAKDR